MGPVDKVSSQIRTLAEQFCTTTTSTPVSGTVMARRGSVGIYSTGVTGGQSQPSLQALEYFHRHNYNKLGLFTSLNGTQ